MATNIHPPQSKFKDLEKILVSKKKEISLHLDRHRTDMFLESENDDEVAQAIRNYSRDFTLITLERELQTLKEIDYALTRLKKGEHGVCSICSVQIPQARLRAIPWTRLCVHCAEHNSSYRS